MWKKIDGRLIQATDTSRVKFRTNISKTILDQLADMADEHDTYINYLLETGLENVLNSGEIIYNKETRPKDRIQYKTTYDKDLLEKVKQFAKDHHLFINDVIEYSVSYIDIEKSKDRDYKNRIEHQWISFLAKITAVSLAAVFYMLYNGMRLADPET